MSSARAVSATFVGREIEPSPGADRSLTATQGARSRRDTPLRLGVHIVGNGGSDLISEASLAIEMGAVADDLRLTIYPHPTLSEAMMEAATALGEAIHIVNR